MYRTSPFSRFAKWTARAAGHPLTFMLALAVIAGWAVTGPLFAFSDTWQLVINTGTTIVTFLMVFLIQNTQNRDALAVHLKLDELIRATREANNDLIRAEDETDRELAELKRQYLALIEAHEAVKARLAHKEGDHEPPDSPADRGNAAETRKDRSRWAGH